MQLNLARTKCSLALGATLALTAAGCGKKGTPAPSVDLQELERLEVLAKMDPGKGFEYMAFSGRFPTIYLDRANERFVVVGQSGSFGARGEAQYFARDQIEAALTSYKQLLVDVGYHPQNAPVPPEEDPNALVVVPMEDLFGSQDRDAGFPPVQADALRNVSPFRAWQVFAGYTHQGNDAPAIGAGGDGLTLIAPGVLEEVPWDQSDSAFEMFREAADQPPRVEADAAPRIEK
jgi:hypothetical protein